MREKTPLRAIVADDHPAVVKGIKNFLERDGAIRVVATARDTLELAEAVDSVPCDYIFADIGMQGIDGENNSIAFLKRFLWQKARPRVIVVTMMSHGRMLAGLVQLGIDGIVDKRDSLECLLEAVSTTLEGGCFLSPSVSETMQRLPGTAPALAGVLSKREWEVFRLYASGLLVHEIAKRFGRSSKTIATQKRSGMRKLGLESEGELVEYLRQVGLV
ncbi:response regulator transcription factor [Caballeronia sp. LZ062]|uniref:response regulator transcription factor n=1 Tax=unclassified Caballeronia TaxID=2646786 RepID=UPI00285E162D|nr:MULTISPECIES: response regulator transcription factor [unclassified Caballeronia]MDR5853529.1 response regulator transcription factor [Caballeronia sp. LZ050]MDR5871937.1 response regulator transcription factor [Caballeronia sp. LZ062]